MNLYETNINDLQVKELIDGVIPNQKVRKQVQEFANKLKEIICEIPDTEERPLIEYIDEFKKNKLPYIYPPGLKEEDRSFLSNKLRVAYKKPVGPLVVGSYIAELSIGDEENRGIDIFVPIPESLFQEKDLKNYRYFLKRNFYVCRVASALNEKKDDLNFDVKYVLESDLNRVSIIVFSNECNDDNSSSKLKFHFKILFGTIEPPFTAGKLAPNKSNTKLHDNYTPKSSPRYNASILIDSSYVKHLKYVEDIKTVIPSISEAIILSKIWLHLKLGSKLSSNKFSGFIMTFLVIYLTNSNSFDQHLNKTMSPFQIFRTLLKYISEHELKNNILITDKASLKGKDRDVTLVQSYELFSQVFEVVILDISKGFNICSFVSKADFLELKHHAKFGLECLHKFSEIDSFKKLLLQRDNSYSFDYDLTIVYQCNDLNKLPQIENTHDEYLPVHELFRTYSVNMFYSALPGRIELAVTDFRKRLMWDLNSPFSIKKLFSSCSISFSFLFNYVECINFILKGPEFHDKEAAQILKKWWGDKLKSMTYDDGSIHHCVALNKYPNVRDNLVYTLDMIQYLINKNLKIDPNTLSINSSTLNSINDLLIPKGRPTKFNSYLPLIEAMNIFSKNLCQLNTLPLKVKTVTPISPSYRLTSTFIPQPFMPVNTCVAANGYANIYQEPNYVLLRLETSPGWPGDLDAIRLTKQAFYMKLAHEYGKKYHQAVTRVNIGQKKEYGVLDDYLEIVLPEGYVIRAYFLVVQEKTIIQKTLNNSEIDVTQRRHLERLLRQYIHADNHVPFYTARVKALCTRYPVLSQCIRLTKRWISAHMLLMHIPEEIVELICINVFVNNAPLSPPTCVFTAFARVLKYIASWDVINEPLILEILSGSIFASDIEIINNSYKKLKKEFLSHDASNVNASPPCMFVFHEENLNGDWWNDGLPSLRVASRLKSLAKASFNRLLDVYMSKVSARDALSEIFTTSYDYYDAIITLDHQLISRYSESLTYSKEILHNKFPIYKNLPRDVSEDELILCSNDVVSRYLYTIKNVFGVSCTLFSDSYGGTVVGIKWNTVYCSNVKFNANIDFLMEPSSSVITNPKKKLKHVHPPKNEKVQPNFVAMLSEMFLLGKGLAMAVYFNHT